jgi:tetratricopeptide (TPR) repeat protein
VARRRRGPLAGFLFFGGTLFPVLGFLNVYPFLYSYVADHYQYLASLGIIVPLASGLTLAATSRRWAPALAALLLVTLGVLSWSQSGLYRDTLTLYTDTVAHNPDCWMAHNNLGRDLLDLPGRVPEAMSHLHEALRLRPNNSMSHYNLGLANEKLRDRLPEAIAEYQAAIRINPDFTEAHDSLGKIYMGSGRIQEAVEEFRSALRSSPEDPRVHNNLGIALARTGQLPEAIAAFDAALRLKPDYADAHCNRGIALAQSGRLPEAIAEFETAQRIDPTSERATRLLERWRTPRQ